MEKEAKNTIIDIIPLTRLPLSRQQSFSYLHSKKIPFGSLVSVPLFRRNVNGIAIGNRDDFFRFGNIKLRKINEVLDEKLLTENQLKIAEFISDYYICPLGIVLKFFVLKKTKSRISHLVSHMEKHKEIILNKEQKNSVNQITKNYNLKSATSLLIAGNEKVSTYLELMSKALKSKKQTLLLVPEIPLVYQALNIIKEYFDENLIALFHSKLTKGELYESYQKIKSGEAKIIIGTRQAILAPFENLGMIIVDEEQDISYKQWDMNPRYSARDVAYKLSEIHSTNLVLCSSAPSLETYHRVQSSKFKVQNDNSKFKAETNLEIIDLRKEGWDKSGKKKRDVLISKKLESEIGFTLKYGKQVFLFAGRRGISSFSVCTKCKEVLRCPRCERALIYDKEGIYRCLHCSYKTDIFPKCPKCNSAEFQNIGSGNQSIEREIKKIFLGAKIKLVDFESLKSKKDQRELFEDINNKKYDIIIGTQIVLKAWQLPHLGLIGIINTDNLLNFTDFNSDERSFQVLSEALEKIKNNQYAKLIIQTYNDQHPVIKALQESDLEKYYQEELAQRKNLKYPPFYRIIKLILRTEFGAKMEKEASYIFGRLKILSERYPEISVFEPFIPQLSKVRDKFRKQIIIKLNSQEIPDELKRTLKNLDSDWIIDIDPISLV